MSSGGRKKGLRDFTPEGGRESDGVTSDRELRSVVKTGRIPPERERVRVAIFYDPPRQRRYRKARR